CREAGMVGTCQTISGAPRAGHTACAGSGVCQGTCNGTNPSACNFPGSSTMCGATGCFNTTQVNVQGMCDGAGACNGATGMTCANGFNCAAGACLTSCTGDPQCQALFWCAKAGTTPNPGGTAACIPEYTMTGATCHDTDCQVAGCRQCDTGMTPPNSCPT